MSTSARHAAATTAARNYLDRVADSWDVTVVQVEDSDVFWQASIEARHPMADDVDVRVKATGSSRDGAMELARLELHSLAYRCAIDPTSGARAANELREGHVYAPSERGNERVRRAVAFHRGAPPIDSVIEQAALSVQVRDGKRTLTVGDVATETMNRQAFPVTDLGQGRIAV